MAHDVIRTAEVGKSGHRPPSDDGCLPWWRTAPLQRRRRPCTMGWIGVRDPTDPTLLALSAPMASRVDTLPEGFLEKLGARLPAIGDVIGGRYRLLRMLGRGAM